MGPDGDAAPFPLFLDSRIGLADELAQMSEGLAAPVT